MPIVLTSEPAGAQETNIAIYFYKFWGGSTISHVTPEMFESYSEICEDVAQLTYWDLAHRSEACSALHEHVQTYFI